MTLLAFFLGGITGAGEFEKFVGEVVIGFRHGGERGGEGGEEMEVPGQLDYKYFVIFCSSYAKHYKPHSIPFNRTGCRVPSQLAHGVHSASVFTPAPCIFYPDTCLWVYRCV